MRRGFLLPGVLVLSLGACGGDRSAAAGSAVRDSAGVRIVESTAPAWGEGEGWRVGAAPAVDLGGAESDDASLFDRVAGVVRRGDGALVVADGGSKQVRIFDAAGRHLASAGREGDGPGEFKSIHWVGLGRADSLLVWDGLSRRLSVLSPGGGFARSVQPEGLKMMVPRVAGVLSDGSLVMTSGTDFATMVSRPEGEYRDSVTYLRFAPDGTPLPPVGRFPGPEMFLSRAGDNTLSEQVTFGRNVLLVPDGGALLAGENDRFEIRRLAPDGALRELVRRAHEPVAATDADVRAVLEAEARRSSGSVPRGQAEIERMVREGRAKRPHRPTLPAFGKIRTDPDGHLWVEEFRRPGTEGPSRWSVFDPRGRWLGTVETPAGLEVHQVGRDWVLGVFRDADDVEHVRLHRLARNP